MYHVVCLAHTDSLPQGSARSLAPASLAIRLDASPGARDRRRPGCGLPNPLTFAGWNSAAPVLPAWVAQEARRGGRQPVMPGHT